MVGTFTPNGVSSSIPDISQVEIVHIQCIRAAEVVICLNALITLKMGAVGSPDG